MIDAMADRILDTVAALYTAARHPDIVRAERYETSAHEGVEVVYRSNAKAHLWVPPKPLKTEPADLPAVMPAYKFRVLYALQLLVGLLDAAKPAGIQAWRLVKVEGFDLTPSGIELRTDDGVVLLKATGGSPTGLDADPSQWADWEIPDGITVD